MYFTPIQLGTNRVSAVALSQKG